VIGNDCEGTEKRAQFS